MGNEKVRERICIRETFDSGNPEDDRQPNIWPPEELLPGFRKFMEEFFQVPYPGNMLFASFSPYET